jgi:signal transduction histidine kinase
MIYSSQANAINYTSSGCVTLHAKQMQSGATTPANTVRVQFSVKDTGAGISKSAQSKLWLPFVRGGMPSSLFVPRFFSFSSYFVVFF